MKEGQGDTASHFRQQVSKLEFSARYSICSLGQDFQTGARPSLSQHCLSTWEGRQSDLQWFIINKKQKFRIIYFLNVSKNDSKVTLIIRSLSFIIISSWRGRARSEGRLWGLIANNLWPLVSILQTILRNHKWRRMRAHLSTHGDSAHHVICSTHTQTQKQVLSSFPTWMHPVNDHSNFLLPSPKPLQAPTCFAMTGAISSVLSSPLSVLHFYYLRLRAHLTNYLSFERTNSTFDYLINLPSRSGGTFLVLCCVLHSPLIAELHAMEDGEG